MATRTISTKLAIEGESQYRAALRNCNTELKTLRSELGYTEEKFHNNANTLEALQNKVKALTDVYEKQSEKVGTLERALENAKGAYDKYSQQVEEARANIQRCRSELEKLENTTGDSSEEQRALTEELEKWKTALQDSQEYQEAAKRGVENWQTQLNNARTEQIKLNDELQKNRGYLQEARTSTEQCASSIDEYGKEIKDAGEESRLFGDKSSDAINKLASALAAAGVAKTTEEIAKILRDCTDAAKDFESAMAGVSKTTDLSEQELADMSDQIQEMSTRIPATAKEIAGVVEAGGQLGIAKENLLDFAEVMVNLGTATNLSSEEAASALAKFANVVKMQPENYERLGSTIVDLGNNFATTEADIVSMATRIASTGEIVGLTEPQIMAIATALSSVGIEAEAGGSAVSKLLKQMETAAQTYGKAKDTIDATGYSLRELELMASNDSAAFKGVAADMELTTTELKKYMSSMSDLQNFADVSGMAAEDFVKAWGTDAVGALGKFITGLGKIDEAGGSSVAVLQEMGITEIRLSNAVQALSSSNGILERTIKTANNAWNENSALAKEAATRYETTESRLQMTANAANNLKIAIGNQLLPVVGELADGGTDVFQWATDFVNENPWIVGAITGLVTALGALAIGVAGLAAAPAIIGALNAALGLLAANPIVLVVSAIVGLTAAIGALAAASEDAGPKLEEISEAARGMDETIHAAKTQYEDTAAGILATANMAERYISKLEEMGDYSKLNNEQQEEYSRILTLLTQTMPELSDLIDIENGHIKGGTDALRANTEAWKENAKAQAFQEQLTKIYKAQADVLVEAEKNRIGLTEANLKAAEASDKVAEAEERIAEIREKAQKIADEINEADGQKIATWDTVIGNLGAEAAEYTNLQRVVAEYTKAQEDANNAAKTYEQAIKDDEAAITKAQEEIDKTEQAVRNLSEAQEKGAGSAGDLTGAIKDNGNAAKDALGPNEELIAIIADLEEQYNKTAEEARKSIESQIDYFGKLDDKGKTSIQNIIKNMEDQAAAMDEYADNITLAMERGVDHGIIEKLSDGSEESAKILAAIVAGTEDEIEKMNAAFAGVQEGTTNFAGAVAEAERQYNMELQKITEDTYKWVEEFDQYDEMYKNGTHTMDGYVEGIRHSSGRVTSAMGDVGRRAQAAFTQVLEINSPSRVFKEDGRYTVQGIIQGVKEQEAEFQKTYEDLAKKALQSYEAAIPPDKYIPGTPESVVQMADPAGETREILRVLKRLAAGEKTTSTVAGGTAAAAGNMDPEGLAEAISKALKGAGVYLSWRKVGELVTRQQENNVRARGSNPIPV